MEYEMGKILHLIGMRLAQASGYWSSSKQGSTVDEVQSDMSQLFYDQLFTVFQLS